MYLLCYALVLNCMSYNQVLNEHGDDALTALYVFSALTVLGAVSEFEVLPDYGDSGLFSMGAEFPVITTLTMAGGLAIISALVMFHTNHSGGVSALYEQPRNLDVGEWAAALSTVAIPLIVDFDIAGIYTDHIAGEPFVQVLLGIFAVAGILVVNYK